MSRLIPLFLLTALLFVACNNGNPPLIPAPNPGNLKNEEVVSFEGTLRTAETEWTMSDDGFTQIASFNKADFRQAKRITFATMIRTSSAENRVFAQLYNVTDSVRIADTELSSACECFRWVESDDIIRNLPDKPVMLALRIRSEKEGFFVMTNYNSFLTVYNR